MIDMTLLSVLIGPLSTELVSYGVVFFKFLAYSSALLVGLLLRVLANATYSQFIHHHHHHYPHHLPRPHSLHVRACPTIAVLPSLSLSLSLSGACQVDATVSTSSRHADLSNARRFAVVRPKLRGRKSSSTVLTCSQDCLGLPTLQLQTIPQILRSVQLLITVTDTHRRFILLRFGGIFNDHFVPSSC